MFIPLRQLVDLIGYLLAECFGSIRTVVLDKSNEPGFVGRDVAKILGYSNATKAVSVHVDDKDKAFPIFENASRQTACWWKGKRFFQRISLAVEL